MININVCIIEDNFTITPVLETLVREMGCYVSAVIDNSDEALHLIYNTMPDLIFMNMDIRGKYSGPELARQIKLLHIPVIRIPVFDAGEKYGNNQLMLYVSTALAFHTFSNAVKNQYTDPDNDQHQSDCRLTDSVFIKKGDALCKVCFKDILYIKADGNYCELQTTGEKFLHKITLTRLINTLPKRHFLKIHRSYVVYIHHIRKFSLSRNELTVGDFSIPVGKGYKATILDCLRKI